MPINQIQHPQQAILAGKWRKVAEDILPTLPFPPTGDPPGAAAPAARAAYLVRRQEFLEALEKGLMVASASASSSSSMEEEAEEDADAGATALALLRGPVAAACAALGPGVGPQLLQYLALLLILLPPPAKEGQAANGAGSNLKGKAKGAVAVEGEEGGGMDRMARLRRAAGWRGSGAEGRGALVE